MPAGNALAPEKCGVRWTECPARADKRGEWLKKLAVRASGCGVVNNNSLNQSIRNNEQKE